MKKPECFNSVRLWRVGLSLLIMGASPVWAHKINLFVNIEGDQAEVMGYFADGKVPKQVPITVFNSQGTQILEGKTNDEGEFRFKLPKLKKPSRLKVKIDAGMGHRAEYLITKEEMFALDGGSANESQATASGVDNALLVDSGVSSPTNNRHLAFMIEKAVAKANRPLRRSLDEMREKASLSDIIGGIGLIFGALGLWFFLQAKKLQPKEKILK